MQICNWNHYLLWESDLFKQWMKIYDNHLFNDWFPILPPSKNLLFITNQLFYYSSNKHFCSHHSCFVGRRRHTHTILCHVTTWLCLTTRWQWLLVILWHHNSYWRGEGVVRRGGVEWRPGVMGGGLWLGGCTTPKTWGVERETLYIFGIFGVGMANKFISVISDALVMEGICSYYWNIFHRKREKKVNSPNI